MSDSYKLTWHGARSALEAASDLLTEILDPPAGAASLTKANSAAQDDDTEWSLEAYFDTPPDLGAISNLLNELDGLTMGSVETLESRDWVAHALEGLGVIQCGRFTLYGIHDADKVDLDDNDTVPIRIDANLAFGTGHHPTTAGCLTLLDRFGGWSPQKILDLGCGSAVLAIAAAKMWGKQVLATDIDQDSVDIAKENAVLNGVGDKISTLCAAGFDHTNIGAAGPFDFVFANILAGPLAELAPDMSAHVKKNGRVMLAGLMSDQEEKVCAAYEENGFRQLNRLDHQTWPVLLFVRQ